MDAKALRQKVLAANADLEGRLKSGGFRLQYDSVGDVFYFALTDYRPENPVVSLEDADASSTGFLRVEDETWKVIGFDIFEWRSTHLKSNPTWQAAFTFLFKLVGDSDFKLEFDPDEDDPLRLYYVPEQVHELLEIAA